MSNNIMKFSTPEIALGTAGMAFARPSYSASHGRSNIMQHHHQFDGVVRVEGVNNEGEFMGAVDLVADEIRREARR